MIIVLLFLDFFIFADFSYSFLEHKINYKKKNKIWTFILLNVNILLFYVFSIYIYFFYFTNVFFEL